MDDFVDETMLELDRFAIGQPVPRSETPVAAARRGALCRRVSLPGQAYAVMVRSGYAHGILRAIGTAAARAMPGVLASTRGGSGGCRDRALPHGRSEQPRRDADAEPRPLCAGGRQGPPCRRGRAVVAPRQQGAPVR